MAENKWVTLGLFYPYKWREIFPYCTNWLVFGPTWAQCPHVTSRDPGCEYDWQRPEDV